MEGSDPKAFVRLIDEAIDDLRRIGQKHPSVLRAVFKKLLLLETDANAGEPLLGKLVGFRKLTAVDRDWRVVWRVEEAESGDKVLTIAEVWAVGARANHEVYNEMLERLESLPAHPGAQPLLEVARLLGRQVDRLELRPAPEPDEPEEIPPWLRERLFHQVRLPDSVIDKMTKAEAEATWEGFQTRAPEPED